MHHTDHTIFEIQGKVPLHVFKYLEKELGDKFKILDDEELVSVSETKWYKKTKSSMLPGDYIRIYRENAGLNQTQLGFKLGSLSKQYVSDLEHSRRAVSKELAKKLSSLLKVSVDKFL